MPPAELIVIDDGSIDDSAKRIARIFRDATIPCELIIRKNRGASHTLNEAIERASCDWILPLNSDDRFGRERLEALAPLMNNAAVDWGYGRVNCIDSTGQASGYERDSRAYALRTVGNTSFLVPSTGLGFLLANPAISTGNLFFRKALWAKVGGFRDWRYHHDWHFALSASRFAEPVFAPEATYDYRIHERNTIAETRERVQAECRRMMKAALTELCDFSPAASENRFAPCPSIWKRGFFATVGGVGFLELLPARSLHAFAAMLTDRSAR
jgi:glycosyltransferase involved in cell wall biosynthesis